MSKVIEFFAMYNNFAFRLLDIPFCCSPVVVRGHCLLSLYKSIASDLLLMSVDGYTKSFTNRGGPLGLQPGEYYSPVRSFCMVPAVVLGNFRQLFLKYTKYTCICTKYMYIFTACTT